MSISEWPINIPNIEDGITTFSANDMNPIIESLATRTEWLKDKINNISGSFGFTYTDEGFDASCKKGMLIAQDPTTKKYYPASASWSDVVRSDGSVLPSWSANVVGVLLTDVITSNADNKAFGSIQMFGCISEKELIDILAPERVVGPYYLDHNGVATTGVDNKNLAVWCYSYLGSGKILIAPRTPEYGGHSHNYMSINTNWKPIAQFVGSFPSTAKVATDTSENPALNNMLKSNPNHICLIKNGQEVMKSDWGIEGEIIYINFVNLDSDEFSIHAITPLTADEPIVRSIQLSKNNNLLNIDNVGGNVFLGLNIEGLEENNYSGNAITELSTNGLKLGPVIQGIRAGAGIDVISYSDRGVNVPGVVEISSTQYKNTLTDMSLCNLNQVLVGTSFNGVGYVFPGGTTSSLIGTIRIPHFVAEEQEGEIVFLFQGNRAAISGLSAQVLIQPMPEVGRSVGIPTSVTYTVPSISGAAVSECYCQAIQLGGENGQRLYSDGLIVCKLEASGGSDIVLVSMSFRLK